MTRVTHTAPWIRRSSVVEAPEFTSRALEALRQPLEEGFITLARTNGIVVYPARVQLVLTANPCPCGRAASDCECPSAVRRRYLRRISGPLLDRIDIQIETMPLTAADLMTEADREDSAKVGGQVLSARETAKDRWRQLGVQLNAEVPVSALRKPPWRLAPAAIAPLTRLLEMGVISARGYGRVLRLAWTVADVDGKDVPREGEVNTAIELRRGERV